MERSLDFYVDGLGFTIKNRWVADGRPCLRQSLPVNTTQFPGGNLTVEGESVTTPELLRHTVAEGTGSGHLFAARVDGFLEHKGGATKRYPAPTWEFCARYCAERFGEEWHLSPELSLLLHAENTVIPSQVVIDSPKAANHKIPLLFGTSLYDLKLTQIPPAADLMVRDGLRIFTSAAATIRVPEGFFKSNPHRSVIALWLGHESVQTTQIYVHADLSLKEKALARVAAPDSRPGRYRPDDALLAFLESL